MQSQVGQGNGLKSNSDSFRFYNMVLAEDRVVLAHDLHVLTQILFDLFDPPLHKYNALLSQTCARIASLPENAIIYRSAKITNHIRVFLDMLNAFYRMALANREVKYADYSKSVRDLKRFVKEFDKTIRPLSNKEIWDYEHNIPEVAVKGTAPAYVFLWMKDLDQECRSLFWAKRNHFGGKESDNNQLKPDTSPIDEQNSNNRARWLESISPDVLNAYLKTEDTLTEVLPLLDNAEDEYFVEQVSADYYPHIFAALKKFDTEKTDFEHKETVVKESIKQFQIVQLGLQKIIDGSVVRHTKALRSQTDFLRNKVLGDVGLSLTTMEAENLIQDSVEEADRIREELYKKHVTPILEQNKQEYEAALVTAKADLALELEANRKVMAEKDAEHLAEKVEIVQQVEEVLFDLDETKKDHEYALFEVRAELTQQVEDKTREMEEQKARHNSTIAEVTAKAKEIHAEIIQLKQRHAQEVADLTRKLQMTNEKSSMGRVASKQLDWTPPSRDYFSMSKSEELELKELQGMIRHSNDLRNQLNYQSESFAKFVERKGITQNNGYGRTSGSEMHGANIAWIEATLASLEAQLEQAVRMEEKSSTALKNKGFELLVQQLYENAEFQEVCRNTAR